MLKIAIFSSTKGTDLPAILNSDYQDVEFSCFITNKKNCQAGEIARKFKIKDYYISPENKNKEDYDLEILKILRKHQIDLIILVGYMKIITPVLINEYPNAILNVHPSLLPAFAGNMNKSVHQAVLERGCKVSGVTIHFVSEEVDEGPILLQESVKIDENETVESLKEKIQKLEQRLYPEAIKIFQSKKFKNYTSSLL